MPLVFVHGLGIGPALLHLPGFLNCVLEGLDGDHRDIFILSLKHFQMRPGWEGFIPSANEVVCCIEQLMQFHRVQRAHFLGHSAGTAVISWLLHKTNLVACCTMVDPVCVLLMNAEALKKNLYGSPTTFGEAFYRFFVFEERVTATFLHTQVFWHESGLVFDDRRVSNIPICFLVGGSDPIIPGYSTCRVIRYQQVQREVNKGPPIEMVWEKDFTHGQFLMTRNTTAALPKIKVVDQAAHAHSTRFYAS